MLSDKAGLTRLSNLNLNLISESRASGKGNFKDNTESHEYYEWRHSAAGSLDSEPEQWPPAATHP